MAGSSTADPDHPVFYYDLGSPRCYIVAETIMATLPVIPEWEPVLGSEIAPGDPPPTERLAEIERQATELGLQSLRWPVSMPPESRDAMLAATYAKRIGRAVAFSLAAFRQAFAGGRDLGEEDTILIAGAACEMHPTALRKGIGLASTQNALAEANRRARTAGVAALPAIQVGSQVFIGAGALRQATAALHRLQVKP